ncbi:hypothetical protein D7D52_12820 [Nocardia yunnanensis]|uniref:Uncharacterized protein n=1 Tax=Nocardia yunnanensis TaxID=2382165 RepID=A0A386ZBE3_9NOCA|nr:hypothetical protein D7D52_12820 [Nocardia yunnanensis]
MRSLATEAADAVGAGGAAVTGTFYLLTRRAPHPMFSPIVCRLGNCVAFVLEVPRVITNLINFLLGVWGNLFAGSSGYHIPPGTLPFGS